MIVAQAVSFFAANVVEINGLPLEQQRQEIMEALKAEFGTFREPVRF